VVGLSTAPGTAPDFVALGGWPGVLGRLAARESLSSHEASMVMSEVLTGRATDAQLAAFLLAMRMKGETIAELAGLVQAMRDHGTAVDPGRDVVDAVGTGGDRLGTINVTTLAALIAAGAGVPMVKHGNRAASSSVGTADVLEALGVAVDLGPAGVRRCVEEAGIGFCFAQRYHPAMRLAGPVRRELGVPTVFNVLGPLANPARARRQLVGVSDPSMAERMAGALALGGSLRAMVVHGDDGLDELSVTAPSTVVDLVVEDDGRSTVRTSRVDPAALGFAPATLDDLRGGHAEWNARVIRRVLEGMPGSCRDIGILNAAAVLVVAGATTDLEAGVRAAVASVDGGHARAALQRMIDVSREAAACEPPGTPT